MPRLTEELLPQLAPADFLYLTTIGRVSGEPRTVELWFVVFEGKLYAVSGAPSRAHWVQNLIKNAKVGVRIDEYIAEAEARVVDRSEQPLWDTVCRMACEKYDEPEPWGTPVEISLI